MSLREFVAAIPKVELNLHLTGALRRESLLMIAKQNGIPAEREDFDHWLALLDKPDFARLDAIARQAGSWAMYPEDIALLVYDMGVALSKQNVVYAEVMVSPPDFVGSARMNFDGFIDALNDGRDRALRGWKVDMAWILCIPRDNPRSGDEVARWASSKAARLNNVVAMGLTSSVDPQPIGQFKRAFDTAHKKEAHSVIEPSLDMSAEEIHETLETLSPQRLSDTTALAADSHLQSALTESPMTLAVSLGRLQRTGALAAKGDYPLRDLLESDLALSLTSSMPSLLGSNLIDEYIMAHDDYGLSADELLGLARRTIEHSFMDADGKDALLRRFDFEAKAARLKWLPES